MRSKNLTHLLILSPLLFFTLVSSAGEADVSGEPVEAVPVFNVGEFNAKPEKAGAELEKSEFSVLSADGNTVQVKKREDFPRNLQAGQRLAIFLENLDRKADFEIAFSIFLEKGIDYNSIPAVEMLYNGNVFYREKQSARGEQKRLFIPGTWHEEGINVLEIRNLGLSPVAFNALTIKEYRPGKNPADTGGRPSTELSARIKGFASSARRTSEYGGILRDKSTRFLPDKIIKYLDEGESFFPFDKFAMLRDFYDPYTGRPILAYHVLGAIAPLFEGRPEKILCNIVPGTESEIFEGSTCLAVRNNENTVTAAVSVTPMDAGKYVDVIVPVPWSGDTEVEVISGLLPEDVEHGSQWLSARSSKKEKVDISNGIFRYKASVKDLAVIRLVQSGKKAPATINLPGKLPGWAPPVFDRSSMKFSTSRPVPTCFRAALLDAKKAGIPVCVSDNYKTEVIPATKGDIDRIKDVVPWDSKSVRVEISYPDGKLNDEEWAKISFMRPPERCNELSFWVYPRSENTKIQRATLLLYLEKQDGGYSFLSTNLKTGIWQRVALPLDIFEREEGFRVVGDPKQPEYAKGNKVSFEFNGFSGIDTKTKNGLASIRVFSGSEQIPAGENTKASQPVTRKTETTIMIGEPEADFEYRHVFKEPMDFKEVPHLSENKGISVVWRKDAQLLEIKGKFPDKDSKPSEDLLKLLTEQEKSSIEKKGLVAVGLKLIGE